MSISQFIRPLWPIFFGLCLFRFLPGAAQAPSEVYALIVGISEYQDVEISDLKYAARDASAFHAFLRSSAGGRLDSSQIRILTDEQASLASIQSGLIWLERNTPAGGRAIFYFAGHGDVERQSNEEKGFLLAYDTPPNNYRLNALGLEFLNEHLSGKLRNRNAQFIVIADACHSGALAGNNIGGTELTARELGKRSGNEIKIMSCQPYEKALESMEWGEGRGVFSYYLISGLQGRADTDQDTRVDLYELEDFLQDHIRKATNKKQHPDVIGGRKNEPLFYVDATTADSLRAFESKELIENIEVTLMERVVSDEVSMNYGRFNRSLERGRLIEPEKRSASFFLEQLYADSTLRPFMSLLIENLTTAMLDSVQQAIRAYLETDPAELKLRDQFDQKYIRFPAYLKKAASLLGEKDPRHASIQARRYYFEGLVERMKGERNQQPDSLYQRAMNKQDSALLFEDKAAYIHNEIGYLLLELGYPDSSRIYLKKARELAPTWAIPYHNLAIACLEKDSLGCTRKNLKKALEFKPNFTSAYTTTGNLLSVEFSTDTTLTELQRKEKVDSAIYCYQQAAKWYPDDKFNYYNYASFLKKIDTLEKAKAAYRKVLAIDSNFARAWYGLALTLDTQVKTDSAEVAYRKAISLDPEMAKAHQYLGALYLKTDRPGAAKTTLLKSATLDPSLESGITTQLAEALIELNQWQQIPQLPLEPLFQWLTLYDVAEYSKEADDRTQTLQAYKLMEQTLPEEPFTELLLSVFWAEAGKIKKSLNAVKSTLEVAQLSGELADYIDLIEYYLEDFPKVQEHKKYHKLLQRYTSE